MTHGLRALGLLRSSTSKIGLFREENEEEDDEEEEEEDEDDADDDDKGPEEEGTSEGYSE
jgi:hypothetical protein